MHIRFLVLWLAAAAVSPLAAQSTPMTPPRTWTAEQDHQNMMDQLGIKTLRPGASSNPRDPNYANYDEAKANPYPNLPEVLTTRDGRRVTSPAMWWSVRYPEIVADMSREVYGYLPANIPRVTWSVKVQERELVGRMPVIATHVIGHVDNASYPLIDVNLDLVLVVPANATSPVPVLMMFGQPALPAPAQPTPPELATLNDALRTLLAKSDAAAAAILDKYPAYQPVEAMPPAPAPPVVTATVNDPPVTTQLLAAGWGYATLSPASIQADNGAGLTRGIIGLVNRGQPRKPDQWGALRAWAWGAGRALDYLETVPAVDAKHVGIEGVSRFGKAALVTEAFDPRFYMGLIGSSGEGGAKLHRHNLGEAVENLTGGEYYWMAGNFMKYGASGASFGAKNAGDLPVDAHELIALCAPRLTFISYGSPQGGDPLWLDQQGSYMATVAAQPVFQLLGDRTLGVSSDFRTAQMPPVNSGLLDGQLAWRQHDGGHTDAPNVKYFIAWADRFMGWLPPTR
jgi:hypothetical protein